MENSNQETRITKSAMRTKRTESNTDRLKIFQGKHFIPLNFYGRSMKKITAVFKSAIVTLFLLLCGSAALGDNIDIKGFSDAKPINVKNVIPAPDSKGANQDIIKYRKMWVEYTKGNNLALGKPFIFSLKPDYSLTAKGEAAAATLTDGKLSDCLDDRIWFSSSAVGWYWGGAENGVNCLLDLGEAKPVGCVVIRALAGKAQSSLAAPAEFKVFVSRDGKNFYEAASMVKLMQNEKNLSNFKTNYYIDETGKAYAYPFKLEVNADARYVGISIKGETSAVFLDEIAVIEGSSRAAGFNEACKGPKQKFITSGILIEPRLKELAISTNINTPNAFLISDMRDKASVNQPASIIIEVPEMINIITPEAKKEAISLNGNKYTRWELPLKKVSDRIFFTADKSANVKLPAYIYAECKGVESEKTQVPIKLCEIPEVKPQLKRLHVSLTWMGEKQQMEYPDYFKAFKTMGFNAIPCFPRDWQDVSSKNQAKVLAFIDSARKEGFKILMNESPFHVMMKVHKEGSEIFSQLKSGQKNRNLCPSYNGEYYQKEMERIARGVALAKPDYVFWDIECWYNGAKEAPACARCLEEQNKSGKSMDEFLKDCGTEKMKDLKNAVRKGVGNGKMPVISCYGTHPTAPNYGVILDFNRFYPASVDTSANSFYVAGNVLKIHDEMRENYKILKSNKCIPYITAGTYGTFPPYKLEQMILEVFMNGACGITYYCFDDFDTPMDFYYHAKALAEIAPYEDLIMDGEVLEPTGSNKELTYSGIRKDNEMLLLIGNYQKTDGNTSFKIPFSRVEEIKDLRSGEKMLPEENIRLDVPKSDIRLLYIKGY